MAARAPGTVPPNLAEYSPVAETARRYVRIVPPLEGISAADVTGGDVRGAGVGHLADVVGAERLDLVRPQRLVAARSRRRSPYPRPAPG